ncbi:MAG: class I SAM-dependent methyltransferase [Thermodesulfovibrionales bacterium]
MNLLPDSISRFLRTLLYAGDRFYCPICDRGYRKFVPFGIVPRPAALCPVCNSLERHRLLWTALRKTSLLAGGPGMRLLHVSPEPCLSAKLRALFEYVSVDLSPARAMMQMDIIHLDFPDSYFDAIVCNHVLEHVPDDAKGLSELYRVLKEGGWASIQVPMHGDLTMEDPLVTDPAERERRFGQADHVRSYGRDFLHRLEAAGFAVDIFRKQDLLNEEMLRRISVECEDEVWISRKPRR